VSDDAEAPPTTGWRGTLRPFLTGVMFLTRIPCPAWVGHDADHLARSTVWFPLIGALVGAWGGAFYLVGRTGWAAPVVGVLLSTVATVWLTGAFHEDALADACDGFGGGWGKDDILRIMKDSRVGSYGVVGLVLVLALKVAALSALSPGTALRALVAAHVLGRWSSLPLIWRYDYARESSGTGKPFAASVTVPRLVMGTAMAAVLAGVTLGMAALPAAAAVLAVTWLGGRYFHRWIGGITGDCLGAANQVAELSVYLVLAFDPQMIPLA
jgi:adenosylcobinamide-GDP ribazoletransferase